MMQKIYVGILSSLDTRERFLRTLSQLQVIFGLEESTEYECENFTFLAENDLCVEIEVLATSLLDGSRVDGSIFQRAENDSGGLACGEPIFSSPAPTITSTARPIPSVAPTSSEDLWHFSFNGSSTTSNAPTTVSIEETEMPTVSPTSITSTTTTPSAAETDVPTLSSAPAISDFLIESPFPTVTSIIDDEDLKTTAIVLRGYYLDEVDDIVL
ncbi:hypothetical protein IV203_016701 [Nitzschia inconspicua]|uniref:Uncharacterized protein n=1 Tax=Nitzschia inconspicua TaxID=303405 RepID=A0A9K3PIH1_9STRA|nr:hypothetical protein IV203_016701 [Nitzschia inconspicua]